MVLVLIRFSILVYLLIEWGSYSFFVIGILWG